MLAVRDKIADATITQHHGRRRRGGPRRAQNVTVSVGQTVPLDDNAPAGAPPPAPPTRCAGRADPPRRPLPRPRRRRQPHRRRRCPRRNGRNLDKQQEIMKRMMEKRKQDGLQ